MTKKLAIKAEIRDRLTRLAANAERPDDELANGALEQYLDYQEWAISEIKAGQADAAAGRTVPHDSVKAWVESLGTGNELPLPQS
jgi:predicted transcriptional regulator